MITLLFIMKHFKQYIIIFSIILIAIISGVFLKNNFLQAQDKEVSLPLPNFNQPIIKKGSEDLIKYFFFKKDNWVDAKGKNIIEKDVIGLRVYKNPDHISPLLWYQQNVPNQGNPALIKVDGYDGLRDGRSIYVSAGYIDKIKFKAKTSGTPLQTYLNTYIYLISYNEGASSETIEIFNRMIANWKFNANVAITPEQKAQLRNDIKRWADINNIKSLLEDYKEKYGYYPKLESGTYMTNHTVSTWPSWQLELGKALVNFLPIDPINTFGSCPEETKTINKKQIIFKYDSKTCWDKENKAYAGDITDEILYPVLASSVYTYSSLLDGQDYYLGYETEFGKGCATGQCFLNNSCKAVGDCNGRQYCQSGRWVNHCGNGAKDCGEECEADGNGSSATNQYKCTSCKWTDGWCGNGIIQTNHGEQCELSGANVFTKPTPSQAINIDHQYQCLACKITGGYCGDGTEQTAHNEQCDPKNYIAPIPADSKINKQYECDINCQDKGGYCGDIIIQSTYGEQCEADGNGSSATNQYKCIVCKWTGGWCGDGTQNGPEQCDPTNYIAPIPADSKINKQYECDINCQDKGGYCGDGIVQNGTYNKKINKSLRIWNIRLWQRTIDRDEECEADGNGSYATNQYKCTSCKWTDGWCGDGTIQATYGEQCDKGNINNDTYGQGADSCKTDCSGSASYCGDGIVNGQEICDITKNYENSVKCIATNDQNCGKLLKEYNFSDIPITELNNIEVSNTSIKLKQANISTPYIWVANSDVDMVSKIKTSDGALMGRYSTGKNPSRTAVDLEGNVWIANRDSNDVTILKEDGSLIKTCSVGIGPRGIAIDTQGFGWVASYEENKVYKIDKDCNRLATYNVGARPYGLAIDASGHIWSANRNGNSVSKIDISTGVVNTYSGVGGTTCGDAGLHPYGIAVDLNDNIWVADTCKGVYKVAQNGDIIYYTYNTAHSYGRSRGVAVDKQGFVWVAFDFSNQVAKINPSDGSLKGIYSSGGDLPIGISGDADGNIWVINHDKGGIAAKINSLGAVMGRYPVAGTGVSVKPYTYSDMMGYGLKNITLRGGFWSTTFESSFAQTTWNSIVLTKTTPIGSKIEIRFQSATTEAGLAIASWSGYSDSSLLSLVSIPKENKFLKFEIKFYSNQPDIATFLPSLNSLIINLDEAK
ncbi:hypothetical protein CVV26_02850 [Candidatus Kuenenbacteria bacterium HGW-Kuenenbacteria-1]|uniref:Uncharacterized protein n=1 Tax=Candidatus Kuenenbacteria bacterium HGW-Kuenenbacteria-1 TaxID=2013812 RepID=A0A2N1UMZ9_9BACT|nr:MAG: hypothetical protein CVV26_02850 [Candidatus Kuenenbacteria bacterium HGW-Kuenenbacteria-1]